MSLLHFYRRPALSPEKKDNLVSLVKQRISPEIHDVETEYCFNIDAGDALTQEELEILRWLLSETFEPENFSAESFLAQNILPTHPSPSRGEGKGGGEDLSSMPFAQRFLFEVGPRMNFTTAWSTNAVSVCHACGLTKIKRIERSRRYRFIFSEQSSVDSEQLADFYSSLVTRHSSLFYDRMTECPYPEPLITFETGIKPEPVFIVPLIEEGKETLRKINSEMGLGLDDWDIDYYYNLFVHTIGRNPTNVECFDLGQSNSEHSRHWFFKGRLIIDGKEMPHTLMEILKQPLSTNPANSIIAFKDNSSAIRGYEIWTLIPEHPGRPSCFKNSKFDYHIIFTAETHNFPTGVAPFPGAETGTGGRIRDVQATGRGGLVVAGTAGYCVANLLIPGYDLPWEDRDSIYPSSLASPLDIEIKASDGASDYGNKFGEPVILGFTRSFDPKVQSGERWAWIKPIMFTGGIGQIDAMHVEKEDAKVGLLIVQVGGPA